MNMRTQGAVRLWAYWRSAYVCMIYYLL